MSFNPARPFAGLERVDFTGLRLRLIDAENQIVGRLAAQLALLLQGKDKPTYAPNKDLGDVCVVVNAERAVLTGNKWDGKVYRWHTGYPGGLREITAKELWRRDPREVLRAAVNGMLPKNNLRDARMRKLRIFPGPEHPFKGVQLVPWAPPPRLLQDRGLGWVPPPGFEPMNAAAYQHRMRGSRTLLQEHEEQLRLSGGSRADVPLVGQGSSSSSHADSGSGLAGFEDLLTAEELALVQQAQTRQD